MKKGKKEESSIRDLRMDVQYGMLEHFVKQFFKEAVQEVLINLDKKARDKPLLTIAQIATKFQVSKATIHNWKNRGLIVGSKLGKNRYYTEVEVAQALSQYGWEYKSRLGD